jgi:acetyl esterase/lipase
MAVVTYSNREPAGDLHALVDHLRRNSAALGIDEHRIGVWASSGNVPLALSLLMKESGHSLKCAVFCCGFMLDLDGATGTAEASALYQFVNPCAGRTIDDVAADVPVFIARAGQEQFPGLNDSIDRFVAKGLAANLPLTVVNHPRGPHAFDMFHDSHETRVIIEQILGFVRSHLGASRG